MVENFVRHTTSHSASAATGIHRRGSTLLASCSASAMPPTSAVSVSRLMRNEAVRLAPAARGPRRSRMISNVARPLTAATRPDMLANRQMPITPTTTTHASESPNRLPTTALVTRSPMSRNPPIAVRMPSATPRSLFTRRSPRRAWR